MRVVIDEAFPHTFSTFLGKYSRFFKNKKKEAKKKPNAKFSEYDVVSPKLSHSLAWLMKLLSHLSGRKLFFTIGNV